MARKLFCDISPTCYEISLRKEYLLRDLKDFFSFHKFAKEIGDELPVIIKSHVSLLRRKLHGVDMSLQENKITNLKIASSKINGIIIHPGEYFSFWKLVGHPSKQSGYVEGLTIGRDGFKPGIGGGLCQLANMIHYLVLNSPLKTTEIHHHSDALFPDERRTVPFGTGASVFYKNLDYRFKNTLDQSVQLLLWVDDENLCGELRCEKEINYRYKLVEEDDHFVKEGEDYYYRVSKVYRLTIDKNTNKEINKELILNNHSRVMYDYSLIPKEELIDESINK